jgi:hypothetical protein
MIKASEVSKETFNIQILVGKLRVLSAQNGISIARLYDSMNLENSPFTDQPGIIVGDYVELKGAFVDSKKKIRQKDTERLDGKEEEKLDIDGIPLKDKKNQKDKMISSLEVKETQDNIKQEITAIKPVISLIKPELSIAKPEVGPAKIEQNTDKKLTSEKTPGPEAHAEQ